MTNSEKMEKCLANMEAFLRLTQHYNPNTNYMILLGARDGTHAAGRDPGEVSRSPARKRPQKAPKKALKKTAKKSKGRVLSKR